MMEYQWYMIPGFECYEINIHTREIRSLKHPHGRMCFHIMKKSTEGDNAIVTLVDDYGVPTKKTRREYYDITFNQGHKLRGRGDNERWLNGMSKVCRNYKSNVNILEGTYEPVATPSTFTLNFESNEPIRVNEPKKVKPFIYNKHQTYY